MLVFRDLLMEHLVWKAILIDAVNEISSADVVNGGFTAVTDNSLLSDLTVLYNFFKTQHFILPNYV